MEKSLEIWLLCFNGPPATGGLFGLRLGDWKRLCGLFSRNLCERSDETSRLAVSIWEIAVRANSTASSCPNTRCRVVMLMILGLATGCQTAGRQAVSTDSDGTTYESVVASNIRQVTFEDAKSEATDSEQGGRDVADRSAAPFSGDASDEEIVGLAATPSVMSLADFESLALGNNPTIQELMATTQKAAGFRTQVGLRANPTVGYQGNQLADQGTDQLSFNTGL